MRRSMRMLVVATTFATLAAGATAQTKPPGCTSWVQENKKLQNNQVFTISGGQCGGQVTLYINLKGKSQFFNDDGVPKAMVRIYTDTTTLPKDDPNDPNDGPAKENRCEGQPRWFDQKFNDFDIVCTLPYTVATGQTRSFLLNYFTDRVSNQPLPKLHTKVSYQPAQTGGSK